MRWVPIDKNVFLRFSIKLLIYTLQCIIYVCDFGRSVMNRNDNENGSQKLDLDILITTPFQRQPKNSCSWVGLALTLTVTND